MKSIKRLTVLASLALAAMAVTAAPALAEGLKWNATGLAGVKGTLTLKKNGTSAVNCELSGQANAWNEEAQAMIEGFNNVWPYVNTKCANGEWFSWDIEGPMQEGEAEGEVVYNVGFFQPCCGEGSAPWTGRTWAGYSEPIFTNGSGSTPSSIDFNETVIGITNYNETITATGKLNVTRSGGLLTVGPA